METRPNAKLQTVGSKHKPIQKNSNSILNAKMIIERLSLDNINYFVDLILELWTDCDYDEEYQNYRKLIDTDNEECYIVREQHTYVAFIHLSIRNDYVEGADKLPIAYIEGIYVKPNHQKKGIAKILVKAAEEWATKKGLNQLASDTDLTNIPSIEFHKKVGFNEVERIVCFIKNIIETDTH